MNIPGLVDLQVNGYKGVDFSHESLTEADFALACQDVIDSGVTAFLPTVITSSPEVYRRNLDIISRVMEQPRFHGRLLGIHLEGPFISPQDGARGAHSAAWVKNPDTGFLDQIMEWSRNKVRLLTIAADVEGAEAVARHAADRGVAVSLGHHMANADQIDRLAGAGATALTHLGNGIPGMVNRHANPLWAGLANDDLTAMIITDSHHLPATVVKCILRVKTPQKCIVTSDAAPLAGMPPGRYVTLGNPVVLEADGKLHNPQAGHLVGSSAMMIDCMNWLASLNLLTLEELLQVGFYNPLKLIGIEPASLPPGGVVYNDRQNRFYPAA
jgi:N-acetylglucosamine-6-phosphate deacetylase